MKRTGPLALLIGLLAASSWGQSQDAYTIKLKTAGKGDVVRVTANRTTTNEWKVYAPSEGDVEEGKGVNGGTKVYTETIFETGADKRPTRLRRQYEKAEETNGDKDRRPSRPGPRLPGPGVLQAQDLPTVQPPG